MATIYYPSLDDCEAIDVEFLTLRDEVRSIKLLVDSGFTGRSSVILDEGASELIRAEVPAAHATGALNGPQHRAWVTCRIPKLDFQLTVIAIVTDVSKLSLPEGIAGIAGLTFLRQFARWGAERSVEDWQFFISDTL